jgi:autotransporter-associated beta strand protein
MFSGAIVGPNGNLTKIGTGTFELSGTNTYSGGTLVDNGKLLLTGSILSSAVTVNTSGTLLGTGRMKTLSCNGTIAPGHPLGGLTCAQDLLLSSQSTCEIELGGVQPGDFDSISVNTVGGTVNLNNASLAVTLGFTSAVSNQFTIVVNGTGNPVVGTFKNLPEGAVLDSGGAQFQITYQGGDGDDVVLTQLTSAAADFTPTLHIVRVPPAQVRLAWPTNAAGFQLQLSTTLASNSWAAVPEPLVVIDTMNTVTLPATNSHGMFRLFKP